MESMDGNIESSNNGWFANSTGMLSSNTVAKYLLNMIGAGGYDKRNKE